MASIISGNVLLLTLGGILDGGVNWKELLRKQGEGFVNLKLQKLWRDKVSDHTEAIAKAMERDGFTWENAANPAWVKGKGISVSTEEFDSAGAGFVLSRDALYRILKATGLPSGNIRDAWRDGADNAVYEGIRAQVKDGMPLVELVNLTLEEMIRHTL